MISIINHIQYLVYTQLYLPEHSSVMSVDEWHRTSTECTKTPPIIPIMFRPKRTFPMKTLRSISRTSLCRRKRASVIFLFLR